MIYFTSDLHLCHNKDFLYRPRGFDSPEEMKKLENVVKEYDPEVLPFCLKSMFNYNKLDQYCMYLAMMYLESIDDMLNVVFSSKRFQCILERFHFNPVSVNETTIDFFPKLKTLRLYSFDERF